MNPPRPAGATPPREIDSTMIAQVECQPVAVGVTAKWDRTRYELLDSRSEVLSMFDAEGTLRGFSAHANHLTVATMNNAIVNLDLDRLDSYELFTLRKPSVVPAIGRILGAETVELDISFQFVVAWDDATDAASAARAAVANVMPGVARWSVHDCALLIDGTTAGWNFQAEFGVVSAAEVPDRLSRRVSRMSSVGMPETGPTPPSEAFPAVASFIDCRWFQPGQDVMIDQVDAVVDTVLKGACKLAGGLHDQLYGRARPVPTSVETG